jgi:hypothetical protein
MDETEVPAFKLLQTPSKITLRILWIKGFFKIIGDII